MATTEQLVREAAGALVARGVLALEVDMRRATLVADFIRSLDAYDDVQVLPDLTGRDRFVVARKREE
jgi:methylase of polypeptide subunit release factors